MKMFKIRRIELIRVQYGWRSEIYFAQKVMTQYTKEERMTTITKSSFLAAFFCGLINMLKIVYKAPHKFTLSRAKYFWFWRGFFVCRFSGHKENEFSYSWCDRCSLSSEEF